MKLSHLVFILFAIGYGLLARLLPHPPNFSPILAIMFIGSHLLGTKKAALVTLGTLFISDLTLGFYGPTMLFVYGSYLLIALIINIFKNFNIKIFSNSGNQIAIALIGSTIFFIVSNLGVFLATNLYPHTFAGLNSCYLAALPFFRTSMVGDIIYTIVFFNSLTLAIQIRKVILHNLGRYKIVDKSVAEQV